MVKLTFFLLSLLLVVNSRGQVIAPTLKQDALFPSLDDLVDRHPDTSCHLRKVDDARVDSLMHRCWFTDREKGMIKEAFAVLHDGQLYIQDQSVRQQLPNTFHPHARKESNCFYPVLEQGRYIFFEILSEDKSPDLSIAMGIMGGVVGSAFGNTLTPPDMTRSFIIVDTWTKTVYGWDTWKDIDLFLKEHDPTYPLPSATGQPNTDDVRKLIIQLNKK
jgi:hypothetical protein